jgi:uncharacterized protein with HEPN domain
VPLAANILVPFKNLFTNQDGWHPFWEEAMADRSAIERTNATWVDLVIPGRPEAARAEAHSGGPRSRMKPVAIASYLEDILVNVRRAKAFVAGLSLEQFSADEKTILAVERAIEIIGEATKRVPQAYRDQHPLIPSREMAGMRDVVSHEYRAVNPAVLYRVTERSMS